MEIIETKIKDLLIIKPDVFWMNAVISSRAIIGSVSLNTALI